MGAGKTYSPEFKQRVVKIFLEEGMTYAALSSRFGVTGSTIKNWVKEHLVATDSSDDKKDARKVKMFLNDLSMIFKKHNVTPDEAEYRIEERKACFDISFFIFDINTNLLTGKELQDHFQKRMAGVRS